LVIAEPAEFSRLGAGTHASCGGKLKYPVSRQIAILAGNMNRADIYDNLADVPKPAARRKN
jgi:hypothetical protein